MRDPNYGYSYSAGASGSFGLKITDGRRLLINLVGTEKKMETSDVQKYFKDLIVTRVKNCIAVELGRYSYNEFNQHLSHRLKKIFPITVYRYLISFYLRSI
mgnify:CR=1 FL=1